MALRAMITDLYYNFFPSHKPSVYNNLYVRVAGIVCGITLIAGLGVWGYRWHRTGREQKAQEAFSSCVREFERAEQDQNLWGNAELVFRLGYEQNKSSSLAPYFLAFQAEALLHIDKRAEALSCMAKAVAALSTSSPVYNAYATKLALMKMDAPEPETQQQGLSELTKLAQNTNNNSRDMALYYLGLYYWTSDDLVKARETWNDLLPFAEGEFASPWARLALHKVEQIVA